ncbi:hypothetical protein SLEP1_g57765 [Rubroshorea leprosula]|uniref:NB-ARC domain-containing protein n=1 Tax=Rubroshorea leprosula TaxID=152421 RepID=A0AAV5MPL9_9ROSI|nr:hypothetical protein SLEP1_g57765 [Rubroshorea leprosula]
MEPIIGSVLGTVGEHVDCHRNFQNDVNDLRKRVADLKRKRDDKVAELQIVDDSEKQVRKEVQGWLEDVGRIIEIEMPDTEEEVQNVSCLSRGSLGRRVRQKIQAVMEIYDRGSFPEGLVIERPPTIGIILPTENMVGEVDMKEKIWEYLRSREVGMIGVCGIGGIGKTTIMKHIHNELLKESIGFTKTIWVTVSQSLSVVKLQGDIAREMNKSLPKGRDELKRASRLQDIMKTVKYALILDDVWDKFTLHRVGIPEPTIENGCKIVITSRSIDVCNYLRCQIVKVPPLPQQESLNLFLDKVGHDILLIPNLENILKDMVAECAGLPLAIVVIAGSMTGVRDIREWRSALRQLCDCVVGTEKDSEDEIFKRLKFSYDRLTNSSIQECFSYCSLYPEDSVIQRADLIEGWICEGLVEKLGSRREMHDRGHEILNRLENNCLLEKGDDGYGEGVKMHDVVRDMALRVKSIGPSNFMVKAKMRLTEIPEKDKWSEDLDKVSLMDNEISYIPINMFPKCLMLSTLILEGNAALKQIPECFLANMPLLKFLNLSYTCIEALPNSICSLKNLTALILRACESLERMPSLSKLKALKKLDLDKAGLCVAPEGIEMLENLEYLDLSAPKLKVLPRGKISKLFRLRYLRKDPIFSNDIRAEEVARLNMLECFEGIFDQPKDLSSFVSELNHFGRPNNYLLCVGMEGDLEKKEWGYFGKSNKDDLLRRVILSYCRIGYEDELVLPDDLRNLWIARCNMVADISIFLRNLTQLQTYKLSGCKGIECVVSSSSSSSSSLTAMNILEKLCLCGLLSLRDIVKVEKTTASLAPTISPHIFSNLKHLMVWNCSKLKKLFPCELLQRQGLQNLEQIMVNDCKGMEEIIGWEEDEAGNQTTTPILIPLPKLRILGLQSLPKLKRIYPEGGVMAYDSFNSIYISNCPKVKRIPLCVGRENGQPSLAAMKEIHIKNPKEWWESLEWENPDDESVLLPFIEYSR